MHRVLSVFCFIFVTLTLSSFLGCDSDTRTLNNQLSDADADADADTDIDADSDTDADSDAVGYYTNGSRIMTPNGQVATFRGINWFGFEDYRMSFSGLDRRSMDSYLDQMVQLGFNLIRLPYSNEMLTATVPTRNNIDYAQNSDLQGKTPLQMLDIAIQKIGQRGMKVILDRHRPTAAEQSRFWYTDTVSEQQWINDWVMLANKYKGNPTIIGADLHNEPSGMVTWGWNNASDWNAAAERCGNAILAANPDWLIIVEGTEKNSGWDAGDYGATYWMGGNLMGARANPIKLNVPNKLVYSTHDYGPEIYEQPWMKDANYPNNLHAVFKQYWGYIAEENIAPILVGEFGIKDTNNTRAVQWFTALTSYIKNHGLYWTYWTWTPDSDDTGGILDTMDWSWQSVNQGKINLLNAL